MRSIKFLKDFKNKEDFTLIDIRQYDGALRVRDLIEVLKKMNPDAICLADYDGSTYAISKPKSMKLREIWAAGEYTGACYFYETDAECEPTPGDDAVFFES